MFAPEHFSFPYPLFVTTIHMLIQFALAAILRFLWPKKFKPERNPSTKHFVTRAVPTAIATSLDIGLSNLSLKTITLTFYSKSFFISTPPFFPGCGGLTTPCSHDQVFIPHLCPVICISFQARKVLLALNWGHFFDLFWCTTHGCI